MTPKPEHDPISLDPKDWPAFRKTAHAMLDAAIDRLENAKDGRTWTPTPDDLKTKINAPLPLAGTDYQDISEQLSEIMPYGPGNTHPRFFGWVNGAGSASNLLAEIAGGAMNVNAGGRNHVAPVIEKQVIAWAAQIMGMPEQTSGLVVTGTSMATIIALKAARDFYLNKHASGPSDICLIGYTSEQAHSCISRAFDMLGICKDNLRKITCNDDFEIDIDALKTQIAKDRVEGHVPFAVIGTAGAVNMGAIDDLDALADVCQEQDLWFHVDGAFGAAAIVAPQTKSRLQALSRVDSLAFDFHKWWQVNYDAGCVLIRDPLIHRQAFAQRPEYLRSGERGLWGGDFWAVDYGPELSRGFRALKVWTHLQTHGVDAIADVVERNINQAQYLKRRIDTEAELEMLAPVPLNICCFRYKFSADNDAKNIELVIRLQESGIAAPSTTTLRGETAIRVNITNHRTQDTDLDILIDAILEIGRTLKS
ncbi:MAG: pyridoxal-dependent decarboxylase [Litorimonas sp.]